MVDVFVRQGKTVKELNRATSITAAVALAKPRLREIVARVLSHQETGVFPATEVSVQMHYLEASPDPMLDVECKDSMERDVQIIVRCNYYPWRDEIKHHLAKTIVDNYGPLLPEGATAWVWLQLIPAGFAIWPPKLIE